MQETKTRPMQTLDQRRAAHAWNAAESLHNGHRPNEAKEYQREAKKLPVRIMTAGLGQSLAFLASKQRSKKMLEDLLKDLSNWVLAERKLPGKKPNCLLESIIEGDAAFLRQATDETLAYLGWLNRFLEAKLGEAEVESE